MLQATLVYGKSACLRCLFCKVFADKGSSRHVSWEIRKISILNWDLNRKSSVYSSARWRSCCPLLGCQHLWRKHQATSPQKYTQSLMCLKDEIKHWATAPAHISAVREEVIDVSLMQQLREKYWVKSWWYWSWDLFHWFEWDQTFTCCALKLKEETMFRVSET